MQDAYRMIIKKNLRKNKNKPQRKELFLLASSAFHDFKENNILDKSYLTLPQRIVLWAVLNRLYLTSLLLSKLGF